MYYQPPVAIVLYHDREGGLREPEGVVCHEDQGPWPVISGMTKRVASFLLMEYFGQKEEKPCGICDVCIGKKKRLHREERKSLEEQILQVLAKQNTNIGSWCVNWVRTKKS